MQHSATIFLVLDFALRVYFGIRIIQRRMAVGVSWAWLCLILFLPLFGTVLYLYLGEYRLGRRRQAQIDKASAAVRKLMAALYPKQSSTGILKEPFKSFSHAIQASFQSPLLSGNDIKLLQNADVAFPQMISDIDQAQTSIDMVFYIWSDGGRADDFGEALIRATKRGVPCRVLVDQIGSSAFLKGPMAKKLKENGIKVRAALTSGIIRSFFSRPDLRVHRKILIIDGSIGYTGSLNLADPIYFNQKVGVGQWVDALARVTGPVVQALGFVFLADWSVEAKEDFAQLETSFKFNDIAQNKNTLIQCLPSGPAFVNSKIEQTLITAIYSAQKELVLTTPYFVPSESLYYALLSAAARGVSVTLIVPKRVDSKLTQYASHAFLRDLAQAGVKVAFYKGGMLHTKSVMIDGELCLFGSLNLDPRSLRINFEITLAIYDAAFATDLKVLQNSYLKDSELLTDPTLRQKPLKKFKEDLARLVGPLLGFLIFLNAGVAESKTVKQDHIEVQIVAPVVDSSKLGIHFKIEPHWHVYWKNPGDSGSAPKIKVTGGELESMQWPYPVRLPVSDYTNYGYEHEVVIPFHFKPTSKDVKFNLEWLVCKVECIPGFAEFHLSDVVVNKNLFDKFENLVPQPTTTWTTKFISQDSSSYIFSLTPLKNKLADIKNIFIYPENREAFLTNLPKIEPVKESLEISVPLTSNGTPQESETFTFVTQKMDGTTEAFTQAVATEKQTLSLFMGIILAFVGGMILNLMPCVFPVLFLKVFSFLKEPNTQAIRKSSWSYSFGVVLSFVVFGGVLTALRLSGEAIGWGYQLQTPWVVYLLTLLFFAMALNFFGFFEIGDFLTGQSSKLSSNRFFSGSFGTGILAVVVASPCTAPFMGSALGLTLLLPAYQSLIIFFALGAGMALPMLLLAYVPQLIKKLPRSGQWMITVKQLMSFPLLATALWLLWVLGNQKGSDAIFITLGSFLIFLLGLWVYSLSKKRFGLVIAVLLLIAAPAFGIHLLSEAKLSSQSAQSNWAPFDEKTITEKRKSQAVFVDFTASWCITCQVNKRTVLNTDEIQELFKKENVYLVKADWTNHDEAITQALAKFNRNSVPLYVFYNMMNEPQILPEILTKDVVKNLFEKEK